MTAADADIPHRSPPSWAILLAFALLFLSWGTTYRATGIAMMGEHMPPALFSGLRYFLAGTILLTWQMANGSSVRLTFAQGWRVGLVALFLFPVGNLLINFGQQTVVSGVAAVLIATTPLWMGLFGMCWPVCEYLSVRGWLGLFIGFAGIVVTMMPELRGNADAADPVGALLILTSAAAWAVGSHISRHMALPVPHLTSAGYQMLMGGFCQVILGSFLGEWPTLFANFSERALLAFTYLLAAGSLCGFVAFNWLLGHVSTTKVGMYAYVNPIIAVIIGACSGEPTNAWLFAGIAVILVGVYLVRGDHAPSAEIELEPD